MTNTRGALTMTALTAHAERTFGPSAADALLALMGRLKDQPVLLARDVREVAAELGVDLDPPAPTPQELAAAQPSLTWRAHGSPDTAVWWGFRDAEVEGHEDLMGSTCTITRHGKELAATFDDGREIWFAVQRKVVLEVRE